MSDQRAVDLVLRARNEVSEGADEAASSLDQLAQEAQRLDAEFRQLEEAGAAGDQFDRLRDSVSELNAELSAASGIEQQIDSFRSLKTETVEAEKAWGDATDRVRELAQELAQAEEPSRALARDFERAKKAAARSKDAFEQKQQALHSLRTELSGSGVDTRNLQDAQRELAERTEEMAQRLSEAKQEIGDIGQEATQASEGFSDMQKAIGLAAGALAALGAKRQLGAVIDEQEQLQRNLLRTEALIESSGRTAETSSQELLEQARALAAATLQSTEGVMEAQQILLGYQNISGDMIGGLTEAAADMATVLQTNVVGATRQLARAFDDPARGIEGMSRVFTAEQREMIRTLAETEGAAQAQAAMLELLGQQFGGVARREAEGLAGAQDTLTQAIQEARIAAADYLDVGNRLASHYGAIAEQVSIFTEALNAGEYDEVVRQVRAIASALTVMTGAYLVAARGATALAAAKNLLSAATARATAALVAFGRVARSNPLGILVTGLAAATAYFVSLRRSARGSAEELQALVEAAELAAKPVSELAEAELDVALHAAGEAAAEAADEIDRLQQQVARLEQREREAAEAGEVFGARERRRLAQHRLDLERVTAEYENQRQRIDDITQQQHRLANATEQTASATRDLADATDDLADAQARARGEAESLLDELGTSFEELETGIRASERATIDAFMRIQATGQLSEQQLASLAQRVRGQLRSDESVAFFRATGEAAAAAVDQAAAAAERSAAGATERTRQLSQAVSELLTEAQRREFNLSAAIDAATTEEEIRAAQQALNNYAREQQRMLLAGERSAGDRANVWQLQQQLYQRQAELSADMAQSSDQATSGINRQAEAVQGLQRQIDAIPDLSRKTVEIITDFDPAEAQRRIDSLNLEAQVRLVVNQQELTQLSQTIQAAMRTAATSVVNEMIREIRRRG